ncbi:YkvA family protein [Azospirillum oryzae]|uniref:YkvA family protein n=1 Tax=Azospirillum oryzae TaxID=286727 RepID=UPI0032AFF2DB
MPGCLTLRWGRCRSGRCPGTPAMAVATAAYALSPIDLIPDFIPVLGSSTTSSSCRPPFW